MCGPQINSISITLGVVRMQILWPFPSLIENAGGGAQPSVLSQARYVILMYVTPTVLDLSPQSQRY